VPSEDDERRSLGAVETVSASAFSGLAMEGEKETL
jgi:hypothetical protein